MPVAPRVEECGSASRCLQGVLGRQLRSDDGCDIEFCVQGFAPWGLPSADCPIMLRFSRKPGLGNLRETSPTEFSCWTQPVIAPPFSEVFQLFTIRLGFLTAGTSQMTCQACRKGSYSEATGMSACKAPCTSGT